MLVVKIELHSAISGNVAEIGRMLIGNDGRGTAKRGCYNVRVLRRERTPVQGGADFRQWDTRPVARTGRVEGFPRLSYSVWRLVARAILSAFPEEQGT